MRHLVTATWDDVPHLSEAQKGQLLASLKPHEVEARSKGVPGLGEGAIFPVSDDSIICDAFEIPRHWRQIGGLDFGYDHPFAATKLAHDLDTDTVYVTAEYRERQATPVIHCAALKPWGKRDDGTQWLPWAWPHDGLQHDKGSGDQLAEQYREQGLQLLTERATFEDNTNGVEAGLSDMLVRMQTGRFKVFRNCPLWMEEKRLYHRKKNEQGKIAIVALRDDLISSTRYGLMMIRFAEIDPDQQQRKRYQDNRRSSTGWMGA